MVVEHRLMTTNILLQPLLFKVHPSIRSDFLNLKYKGYIFLYISHVSITHLGRGVLESGRGPNMVRFRPSSIRLVYFLRNYTEFHVHQTECQIILLHFLLIIFS